MLAIILAQSEGTGVGSISEWAQMLERIGALGVLFLFGWVFLHKIAPRQQADHQKMIEGIIDRQEKATAELVARQDKAIETLVDKQETSLRLLRERSIMTLNENRESFLASLAQQRTDFITELQVAWRVMEKLEQSIDAHHDKAEQVWAHYGFLPPEVIDNLVQQYKEIKAMRQKDEIAMTK